jgi:hypothetical protein
MEPLPNSLQNPQGFTTIPPHFSHLAFGFSGSGNLPNLRRRAQTHYRRSFGLALENGTRDTAPHRSRSPVVPEGKLP